MALPSFSRRSLQTLSGLSILGLSAALAAPSQAAEAHVHGLAQLQVALENGHVDLIFTSPAANIVGFEHAPKDDVQRKAVADAAEYLESQPLFVADGTSCTLKEASVSSDLLGADHEHKHDDDHDGENHAKHEDQKEHHHDHAKHGDAKEHDHDHEPHGDAHTDFTVAQQLECDGEIGSGFTTPLLERFGGIEQLQVQWVRDSSQGSASLTSGNGRVGFTD